MGGRLHVALASIVLAGCGSPNPNVTTYHNDNMRTGAYLAETILTPKAVSERGMHVKYWVPPCEGPAIGGHDSKTAVGCIFGAILTQPLYLNRATVNVKSQIGTLSYTGPVVIITTTANQVYALAADSGTRLWMTDFMRDSLVQQNNPGYLSRWIASTPVIDPGTNVLYVVFGLKNQVEDIPDCKDVNNPATRQHAMDSANRLDVRYWIAAIDIFTGDVLRETQIDVPFNKAFRRSDGSQLGFVGKNHTCHAALLLHQGSIYVAFGSPAWAEGCIQFHGWLFRYDTALTLRGIFNTSADWTQNGNGAGIWQGGGGLAADTGGVYFLTGDGLADTRVDVLNGVRHQFYGDSFLRLRPAGASFQVSSFTPSDATMMQEHDADLGAGGALIVPDSNVVVGGGKSGIMYVLDRGSMTKVMEFYATTNVASPASRDDTWNMGPHLHGSPTYWSTSADPNHGFLYVWGEKDYLRQHVFDRATRHFSPGKAGIVTAIRACPEQHCVMPGGMMSVSADNDRPGTGIVWATLPLAEQPNPYPGGLYAFNAESLDFLWATSYGTISHWVPPTIAGGKVFLAEGDPFASGSWRLAVYELGNGGSDRQARPILPDDPNTCVGCHRTGIPETKMTNGHGMTGGLLRMKPGMALAAITPSDAGAPVMVLRATGERTYTAAPGQSGSRGLMWTLKDTTAELTAIELASAGSAPERRPAALVTLAGSTWSASDGSTVTAEIDRTTPAPEPGDMDWALFRAVQARGNGVLANILYVQQVYTHAGRPPADPPANANQVVRVPFLAEYWFYR
jgi:outer membrane protein assembly factor BamB